MEENVKKSLRRIGAAVLSAVMVMSSIPGGSPVTARVSAQETKTQECKVHLNGDDIRTDSVNGLTFKGFGLLSANSTSDLLMDYKVEHPEAYNQLIQYLFGGERPIMNHVKLEMGNDRNTSTGAQTCTKRTQDEKANVTRDPSWQLAADAKKVNPKVKVSILKWCAPAWANTDKKQYQWYKESILAAYETYGYMVDYINPNTNERWSETGDPANTKQWAKWIAQEDETTIPDADALAAYHKIKLVISDEAGTVSDSVADALQKDQKFMDATDVVGYHYSPWDDTKGRMKWLADEVDKEVWNSEAQATFSNSYFRPSNNSKDGTFDADTSGSIGGTGSALEMANTFIKGFVESRRSHIIYQPAIGSFYEGGQYSFKELVSARDPWSGYMHYDTGLLILEHLARFAKTGWENEDNTEGIWRGVVSASKTSADGTNPVNGRNGGANYITLAAPTKDDFSTMIVNDSDYTQNYTLSVENMKLDENQKLELWETRAADDGAYDENYMKDLGTVEAKDGTYTFTVKPYSTVTVTTLELSQEEKEELALPKDTERNVLDVDQGDGTLYADDFEYSDEYMDMRGGQQGASVRYGHNVNGAFESYLTESGNHVLRQQLDKETMGVGSTWSAGDATVLIGDFRWANYTASVDVNFESTASKSYAAVAIRQYGSSQKLTASAGYTLRLDPTGEWTLYRLTKAVATGTLTEADGFQAGSGAWNNLSLSGNGATITASVNGKELAVYVDETPITSGRVGLGSNYSFTQFDNLKVTKIAGTAPYYSELLDNMETYDLTEQKNAKLVYSDGWARFDGCGMYCYQRSMSSTSQKGATLTYTFEGTGLELLAAAKKSCKIRVTVDGNVAEEADTYATKNDNQTIYSLNGLSYGTHTVQIELVSGTLYVDTVGILSDTYGEVPAEPTQEPLQTQEPQQTQTPAQQTQTPAPAPAQQTQEPTPQNGQSVSDGTADYTVTDAAAQTVTYRAPVNAKASSVTVPDQVTITVGTQKITYKVTGVADNAFAKNKKLKSVVIGKNVTTIGKKAFFKCSSLKKIKIKSTSLKKVGAKAIQGIASKAVITCNKKCLKNYKKLFSSKTGYKKSMKIKKG